MEGEERIDQEFVVKTSPPLGSSENGPGRVKYRRGKSLLGGRLGLTMH